jgi:hypothetical protein
MSMVVYGMKANIPPDSDGKGRLVKADIRYAVIDEYGELDVHIQSVNGVSAVIPKGAGRGVRADLPEGLRDRAKLLALHHYFANYTKYEFEY